MKPVTVAGTSAVIAVAVVMALASASLASRTPSRVSPLLAKEMAVLTNQGISPARTIQAIEAQGRVAQADLLSKLEAAMGAAYAGVWFDNAAAQLNVGVTSPASRAKAEQVIARAGLAADVTVTQVRSTMPELLAAQTQWNRRIATLFARNEATAGLEPQHNAVAVTVTSSVPAPELAALKREATAANVNVLVTVVPSARLDTMPVAGATECNKFETFKAYCNPSITSGVTIASKRVFTPLARATGKSNNNTTLNGFQEAAIAGVGPATGNTVEGNGIPANTSVVAKPSRTSLTISNNATAAEEASFEFNGKLPCTAGPLAIPIANKRERVLLTAGHCIEFAGGTGQEWVSFKRNAEELLIGKASSFVFGGFTGSLKGDSGYIPIEAVPGGGWQSGQANDPVFAGTTEWSVKNPEPSYPVKGEKATAVGNLACHEGQTSGQSCGVVTQINIPVNYGTGKVVEGLSKVEESATTKGLLIESGDSGGPFLFIEANNEVRMEGITSGNEGVTKGFYQPLRKAAGSTKGPLEEYNLELLTTANEVIPPVGEFKPGTKQTIKGDSGSATLENSLGTESVSCTSDNSNGEITGPRTIGAVVIVFSGCRGLGSAGKCTAKSTSAKGGEIVTATLKGELGTVKTSEAASGVGLLLLPASGTSFTTIEGTCLTAATVSGDVAGEVNPTFTTTKSLNVLLLGKAGMQGIKAINLLGRVEKPSLTAFAGLVAASENTTEVLLFTTAVEVA
jgi:hypothetical protein